MKQVVRKIDLALKNLYALPCSHSAERFLIARPIAAQKVASGRAEGDLQGALFVQGDPGTELGLGIFLSQGVRQELRRFSRWKQGRWTHREFAAFCVAVEEVSHFNYLVHHGEQGRSVSLLELELQGEIDKFALSLFAAGVSFETLFEKCFNQFHLNEALSSEERDRYLHAIVCARRFVQRNEMVFRGMQGNDAMLKTLRHFYRLPRSEKIRF